MCYSRASLCQTSRSNPTTTVQERPFSAITVSGFGCEWIAAVSIFRDAFLRVVSFLLRFGREIFRTLSLDSTDAGEARQHFLHAYRRYIALGHRRSSFPSLPIVLHPPRQPFWYFPPISRTALPRFGESLSRSSAWTGTRTDSI